MSETTNKLNNLTDLFSNDWINYFLQTVKEDFEIDEDNLQRVLIDDLPVIEGKLIHIVMDWLEQSVGISLIDLD
jgi:hypothetical protein